MRLSRARPTGFMTEAGQSVICLDFDGVLCDSINECLIVSYSVFYEKPVRLFDEVPVAIRDYFLRYRYFVAPAENYCLIFQAYESGIPTLTRERFDALAGADTEKRRVFGQKFFDYRNYLRKDLKAWLQLHVLFAQAHCVRDEAFPSFNIMTTKDRTSVELLAESLGFSHKLKGIYSKELSVDKYVQVQTLLRDNALDPQKTDIVFVDDNIEHLHRLDGMGLHLYHAVWGYCDREEVHPFAVAESLDFINSREC